MSLVVHGVPIAGTFAEAFDMKYTRLIVTAHNQHWLQAALTSLTGFGTSVIGCGLEIAVERMLSEADTPDGRVGASVLAFAISGQQLEKQVPNRIGQCILTCPSTALFAGLDGEKRVPLGRSLRYFGDGFQISKMVGEKRYWRIPVMDGEFLCEHDVGRGDGVGGGNFLLLGRSRQAVMDAAQAAVATIAPLTNVITPFPGGVVRSGSKVGSRYRSLMASTNHAYCPSLRGLVPQEIDAQVVSVLEVVIDGTDAAAVSGAMRLGITAACQAVGAAGLAGVTAGNYGGKLGRHHFHLEQVLTAGWE